MHVLHGICVDLSHEGKGVFNYHHTATVVLEGLFVERALLVYADQFGLSDADAELLVAGRTQKNKRLSLFVFGFVKDNVIVTFGASHSLHVAVSF